MLAKHLKESVSDITPPPWTEFARLELTRRGPHRTRIGGTSDVPRFSEKCMSEAPSGFPGCAFSMEDALVTETGQLITYPREVPPLGNHCNSFRRRNSSQWMGKKAEN